jgi:hypothetical protein
LPKDTDPSAFTNVLEFYAESQAGEVGRVREALQRNESDDDDGVDDLESKPPGESGAPKKPAWAMRSSILSPEQVRKLQSMFEQVRELILLHPASPT